MLAKMNVVPANFENIKHVLRCGSMHLLPTKFSNHLKICKFQNVGDTDKAYFPSPERTMTFGSAK